MSRHLLGIDVGGTFTDLVSVDLDSGRLVLCKVPSTPDSPDRAVVAALQASALDPGSIDRLVHGSTVSTNAILERTGATVGLITTAGFRDVLEIGNTDRAHLYDLSWTRPPALVPRHRRVGVPQRTDSRGNVLEPLNETAVSEAVEYLLSRGVDAVAVCFLHAYANPVHEVRAREIITSFAPDIEVSISSEVMNSMREFDRTSTVVVDAYVKPVMSKYLTGLESRLTDIGLVGALQVMRSSGGVMTANECAELPVHTLLSGPAGGVVAAQRLAEQSGFTKVITLDIGGTSADAALIIDGRPRLTTETEVDWGIPVQVPMIDIKTIGAGGGSIARIDRGGRLKVGPESAGARPGPACFGFGGTHVTVTDANLVLGYLSPHNYAGGTMPLHADLAAEAVDREVGKRLGFSRSEAAQGILNIVNANMRNLIRRITVQQGLDPREFALMAFGGGGPVHAVAVARELGIRTVLIPRMPGVLSAFGLLLAVPRHDYVQALPLLLHELEWTELQRLIDALKERGVQQLFREGVGDHTSVESSLDMQFERQNYTVNVPFDSSIGGVKALRKAFDAVYEQKFGYRMDGQPVSIVNCRVSVSAPGANPTRVGQLDLDAGEPLDLSETSGSRTRSVYFDDWAGFGDCPIIDRRSLCPGDSVPSPSVVEQIDTSVVVPPGVDARVDESQNIVISLDPRTRHRGGGSEVVA